MFTVAAAVQKMLDMNADKQLNWFDIFTVSVGEEIMKEREEEKIEVKS